MNLTELESWLKEIQDAIEVSIDISEPQNIMEKINKCSVLLGLSSQTVALSEKFYNERLSELVLAKQYSGLGATDKKMLFAGLASKEIELMTKAERLNRALTHTIEGCRSSLSYLKSELEKIN